MERKKSCRLCLSDISLAHSLLENNGLTIFETLTSIKIAETDTYSKFACTRCWLNLKLAYQIQQKFIEANKQLEQIQQVHKFETIEIKEESITDEDVVLEHSTDSLDKSLATIQTEIISTQAFETFQNMCPICNRSITNVLEHLKTHYSSQKCEDCDVTFNDILSYKNHLRTAHSDNTNRYTCKTCNLTFQYKSLYSIHMQSAHKNNIRTFGSIRKLVVNRPNNRGSTKNVNPTRFRKVYPISKNPITPASRPIPTVKKIRKVVRLKSDVSKTVRPSQQTETQLEVLEYDSEGNIKCPQCQKTYQNKRQYSAHKATHFKRQCPICNLQISSVNLTRHIEMHSAKSVVCHLCGAVAKNISSLRGHLYYTHSTRVYPCEHCGKTFKKQYVRDLHVKKEHTGEKSYTCDTCGKSFFTQHNLSKHIRMTHLKLRPFVCEYCEKKFCSKHALRTHVRQHTNEAPYVCPICGEGFRQNVSLKAHKKSKHKIVEKKEFACKVCHKMFADEWAVKSHMRLHL